MNNNFEQNFGVSNPTSGIDKSKKIEGKWVYLKSSLQNKEGNYENLHIKLGPDGKPMALAFFDIDKTLLELGATYEEIRKKMWPTAVERDGIEEVNKIHLAGFRLGTMWRELFRGIERWKDSELYEKEFLGPGKEGEHIDEAGDKFHELSDKLLREFDDIAAKTVEEQAKGNPELFEKAKIKPMYKLIAMYKKMGIPIVGMTANPRKFVEAICKYTGLAENFVACATDTDVPGKKEYKMEWLIKELKEKGLLIPYDKLFTTGDSWQGDVKCAKRFRDLVKEEHPEVNASGTLIIGGEGDLTPEIIKKLKDMEDDKDTKIDILDHSKVPIVDGKPEFFSKRKERPFWKKL
jgi:phosphoglycolate phosphatase-like HAD superfamily hydrolase